MSEEPAGLILFILGLFFFVFSVWITILIIRWVFRIDDILDYLKRIADKLDPPIRQIILEKPPPPPPDPPMAECECCTKELPASELTSYKDKKVCPACKKFLSKKP